MLKRKTKTNRNGAITTFNVVYHVKCMDCDDDYIVKIAHILNERIHEHTTKKDSHIYQHMKSEKNWIDLLILIFRIELVAI